MSWLIRPLALGLYPWALAQSRILWVSSRGSVVAAGVRARPEYILPWPGPDADHAAETVRHHPGAVLTLVTGGSGDALGYAAAHGLAPVDHAVLLTAPTEELNTPPELPENAGLAQAPLELYDVVEISVFDHPTCQAGTVPTAHSKSV